MNAQREWKKAYRTFRNCPDILVDNFDVSAVVKASLKMDDIRREAALERKIEALERRVKYLEADLHLAQQQVAESEERREFAARLEFGG